MSKHSEAADEAPVPAGSSVPTEPTVPAGSSVIASAPARQRRTLRIAFVPGVTITKWSRIWSERRPEVALEFVSIPEADQLVVLQEGRADISFVRHPIDLGAVNAIRLYEELPVVVASSDDPIAELPNVTLADLAGYTVHQTPAMPLPDAIELIAAGVGVVVVPHSVARLHSRKDLVAKQVTDAPETAISIAWLVEEPDFSVDNLGELIDEFVGIVRGRSANSSRSAAVTRTPSAPSTDDAPAPKKPQPKAPPLSAKAQAKANARAKANTFARRTRLQQDRRKPGR